MNEFLQQTSYFHAMLSRIIEQLYLANVCVQYVCMVKSKVFGHKKREKLNLYYKDLEIMLQNPEIYIIVVMKIFEHFFIFKQFSILNDTLSMQNIMNYIFYFFFFNVFVSLNIIL